MFANFAYISFAESFVVFEQFTSSPWYSVMPVGVNTLGQGCVPLPDSFAFPATTLRAMCATRLFDAGVDEQLGEYWSRQ